ncbi:28231_t:CDS:2 [Racocetra persica]|uniref:28231_t:CDS:1 n=1 Tax=Racocetra persica TaxID=160502 RepID=A0ACA9M1K6_9GLOM|nr:28231_t:CDS:2 [Racocetra persica]
MTASTSKHLKILSKVVGSNKYSLKASLVGIVQEASDFKHGENAIIKVLKREYDISNGKVPSLVKSTHSKLLSIYHNICKESEKIFKHSKIEEIKKISVYKVVHNTRKSSGFKTNVVDIENE